MNSEIICKEVVKIFETHKSFGIDDILTWRGREMLEEKLKELVASIKSEIIEELKGNKND